jgi:hypothetical protein
MKLVCMTLGLALAGTTAAFAQAPAAAPAPPPPPPPITAESKAPVVKGAEVTAMEVAFWSENGKAMIARGPDVKNAPKTAAIAKVKAFPLGGGQMIRQVTFPKGAEISAPKGGDTLVYVTKGKMELKLGSVTATVGPGDAFRKIAVQDNVYKCIEETTIVETDAPK